MAAFTPATTKEQFLSEIKQALRDEIDAIRNQGTLRITVHDGQYKGLSGGKHEYYFRLEAIITVPDDTQISLTTGERTTRGFVVSVEGLDILLALDEFVGDDVPSAKLESEPYRLLQLALEHIEALGRRANGLNIADKLFGFSAARVAGPAKVSVRPFSGFPPNDAQQKAVNLARGGEVSFVWGPPGTGKTITLAWITEAFLQDDLRCLIVANTNVATDKAILDVAQLFLGDPLLEEGAIVRWGPMHVEHDLRAKVDIRQIAEVKGAPLRDRLEQLERESKQLLAQLEPLLRALEAVQRLRPQALEAERRLQKIAARQRKIKEGISAVRREVRELVAERKNIESRIRVLQDRIERASHTNRLIRVLMRIVETDLKGQLAAAEQRTHEIETDFQRARARLLRLAQSFKRARMEVAQLESEIRDLGLDPERLDPEEVARDCRHIEAALGEVDNEKAKLSAELAQLEREILEQARVVATTLARCYSSEEMARQEFDAIIVDEASMAPLPMLFIAAHRAKSKAVIIGDFKQLSPIAVAKTELVDRWLRRSIFDVAKITARITAGKRVPNLVQLRVQNRMRPEIARLANVYVYGGRLEDGDQVGLNGQFWLDASPGPGHSVAVYDLSSIGPWCGRREDYSRFNPYSAAVAGEIVHHAKAFARLPNEQIAVITPYRAQANLTAKFIEDRLGGPEAARGIIVSTVHRFQGLERELVVFDVTDSAPLRPGRLIDGRSERGDDEHLVNVAITRARSKLIFVANIDYMRQSYSRSSLLLRLQDDVLKHGKRFDPDDLWANSTAGYLTAFDDATLETLEDEVAQATQQILLLAPSADERGAAEAWRALSQAIARGCLVWVLTKRGRSYRLVSELFRGLVSERLKVVSSDSIHDHTNAVIVDGQTVWLVSDCLLRDPNRGKRMIRLRAPGAARELARILGIGSIAQQEVARAKLAKATGDLRPICEECGKEAQLRRGRRGIFIGCTTFPKCRWTRNITREEILRICEPPECPNGHGTFELKYSWKNRNYFWGCAEYPDCRQTAKVFD